MMSSDLPPPWSGYAEAITDGSDAFNIELLKLVFIVADIASFISNSN